MSTTESQIEGHDEGTTDELEIFVNNKPVVVPKHTTGAEIKRSAHVPEAFQLFRIDGKEEHLVENGDKVNVHKGERFIAAPSLDPS